MRRRRTSSIPHLTKSQYKQKLPSFMSRRLHMCPSPAFPQPCAAAPPAQAPIESQPPVCSHAATPLSQATTARAPADTSLWATARTVRPHRLPIHRSATSLPPPHPWQQCSSARRCTAQGRLARTPLTTLSLHRADRRTTSGTARSGGAAALAPAPLDPPPIAPIVAPLRPAAGALCLPLAAGTSTRNAKKAGTPRCGCSCC